MISSVPESLLLEIEKALVNHLGKAVEIKRFQFSSGGCINNTGTIETSQGDYFIKWNSKSQFPGMFEYEARGLQLLKSGIQTLTIPDVNGWGDDGENIFIIMENIKPSIRHGHYWEDLGSGLAELHKCTSDKHGLDHDNYIGSLNQINTPEENWIDFFIRYRLEYPFEKAYNRGLLGSGLKTALDSLISALPGICPNETPASLMHGDLWSGNLMTGSQGEPCLIDPAVYFGFREMEIAFTQLFGRYSDSFYHAYNDSWPLEKGFEERIDIWNLYPLLVHVNLFGAGYVSSVQQILSRFR